METRKRAKGAESIHLTPETISTTIWGLLEIVACHEHLTDERQLTLPSKLSTGPCLCKIVNHVHEWQRQLRVHVDHVRLALAISGWNTAMSRELERRSPAVQTEWAQIVEIESIVRELGPEPSKVDLDAVAPQIVSVLRQCSLELDTKKEETIRTRLDALFPRSSTARTKRTLLRDLDDQFGKLLFSIGERTLSGLRSAATGNQQNYGAVKKSEHALALMLWAPGPADALLKRLLSGRGHDDRVVNETVEAFRHALEKQIRAASP